MKRPATAPPDIDGDALDEAGPKPIKKKKSLRKAGFKDANLLASSLAPHIRSRYAINYTSNRSMKAMEKKKLTNTFTCKFPVLFSFRLTTSLGRWATLL